MLEEVEKGRFASVFASLRMTFQGLFEAFPGVSRRFEAFKDRKVMQKPGRKASWTM